MTRPRLLIRCALTAALFGVCAPLHARGQDDPLHRPATAGPAVADAAQGTDAVARGKAIFEGKGACQSCHRVNAWLPPGAGSHLHRVEPFSRGPHQDADGSERRIAAVGAFGSRRDEGRQGRSSACG